MLMLLAACGPDTQSSEAQRSKAQNPTAAGAATTAVLPPPARFRIAMAEAPSSVDPLKANSAYATAIINNVYDTLYRYKLFAEPADVTPNLALSAPEWFDGGKRVVIRLRRDARFSDHPAFPAGRGRAVTAHDVVYSLKRHFVPSLFSDGAWLWSDYLLGLEDWKAAGAKLQVPAALELPLAGLQPLDDYTLQIRLIKPMPNLAHTLASGYSAVVAKEVVAQMGPQIARQAIGSGPYLLAEFDAAHALLKRNPNFRSERFELESEGFDPALHADAFKAIANRTVPMVDELDIQFLSSDQTQLLGLQSGQLQASGLSGAVLESMFADFSKLTLKDEWAQNFEVGSDQEMGAAFTQFNLLDPELGDVGDAQTRRKHQALRCAISKAYDWQARALKINGGAATVFRGVIPPGTVGFRAQDMGHAADLPAAKALLERAGYRPETLPELTLSGTGGLEQQRIFELFRTRMLLLGFPAEKIRWRSFPSFGAFIEAVNRSELQLMDMGWQLDVPDAENILQLYYGPYKAPQLNSANYQNAAFDQAYRRLSQLAQGPERIALMAQMNQMLIDDCAVMSGISRRSVMIWRKEFVLLPRVAMLRPVSLRFVARR